MFGQADPAGQAIGEKIGVRLSTAAEVAGYPLSEEISSNPIAKGRLLAELERSALVVAVGDGPTQFAAHEIDDVPVFFLDAGLVRGRDLKSGRLAGLFAFNVDRLLDAVEKLWPGTLGLVYTPGYEPVVEWVRRGARLRGLAVVERRVDRPGAVPGALDDLATRTRSIWLAGDPLLASGAAFEFASELSLSRRIPLIASSSSQIAQGAALGFSADPAGFVAPAAERIDAILRSVAREDSRFAPAPAAGKLLVNPVLARKWGLKLPSEPPREPLR